ncbi:hypothetical protein [Paraclostridium bifermentans]|uniref:hypothetical protein n=1 Tax=Paraclostridium bifermentans TaxID=1490 RepID=UPI00374FD9D2
MKKRGIILDYWIITSNKDEYKSTNKIIRELKNLGIEWYANRYNEIMVKYALFP